MIDDEIRALERKIAEGDLTAWPVLDGVLRRAGRPPRRVWMVHDVGGEYSDRWEGIDEPLHATKEGALAHLERLAAAKNDDKDEWRRVYRLDPMDNERFVALRHRDAGDVVASLFVSWSEVVA